MGIQRGCAQSIILYDDRRVAGNDQQKQIKMKFFLSVVVLVCAMESVFTQGPRCDDCHEVTEEVGRKMIKGRSTLINVEMLKDMCPRLEKESSKKICENVVNKWQQVLIEDRKEKHENSIIENVFNMFNWYYVPRAWVDFKSICQLLNFCFA